MRAYSGMPASEFIAQLRDVAIGAKASPLFIDAIDQLCGVDALEAEHEEDMREVEREHEGVLERLDERIKELEDEVHRLEQLTGPAD